MFEFMRNSFYLLVGVICLTLAALILYAVIRESYKEIKGTKKKPTVILKGKPPARWN